jgi:hypothetical protein
VGAERDGIDDDLREWIERQPIFFVASAPLDAGGNVNVSPKGPAGSLRVLDENRIAYLDVVGSGAETIAHVRENGRIVVMLCSFGDPPRILRLHGRGRVVTPQDEDFAASLDRFGSPAPDAEGAERAIVVVDVRRIQESPGRAVPRMEYAGERSDLNEWAADQSRDALRDYQRSENAESIDGLPAVDWLQPDGGDR